ncbi:sugar transferase [Aquihabitans sp. McL0605]|uniref:sugar transferase n=1 Tax=Aquihabitans sp. McL0605 TaxID=3415671 RepID=UPI003CF8659A
MLDATCIAAGWLVAVARNPSTPTPIAVTAGATAAGMAELVATRLHRSRSCTLRSVELGRLFRVPIAAVAGGCVSAAVLGGRLPSSTAVEGAVASLLLLATTRAFVAAWFRGRRSRGIGIRRVVLVGTNHEAEEIAVLLTSRPDLGYEVVGVAGPRPHGEGSLEGIRWVGRADQAADRAEALGATGVVVAVTALDRPDLQRLVTRALEAHLHVQMSSGLGLLGHRRLVRTPVGHDPWCYVEANAHGRTQVAAKRAMDLAFTVPLLIITAPFLAVAAILIKLEDHGPVLFRQLRVGLDGRLFLCLKLRTMAVGAEDQLDEVQERNERTGPLYKAERDPRVTHVGRLLRASSLDELPQLINVLRGQMSLVGPRPALPDEVSQFDDDLRSRVRVPPGLTGLWQVEARDNPSFHAYRHLDLFYVENRSLVLDLTILAMTPLTVAGRLWRTERNAWRLRHRPAELVDIGNEPTHVLEAS